MLPATRVSLCRGAKYSRSLRGFGDNVVHTRSRKSQRVRAVAALLRTVCALLIAACGASHVPISASGAEPVNSRAPDVTLELVERKPSSRGHSIDGRVRVTNRGDHTAWFLGYDANTPIYRIEQLVDGNWRDETPLHCGTGLKRRSLAPGESRVWDCGEWIQDSATTRIGISFSSMNHLDDNRGAVLKAWSAAFEP